MNINNYYCAGVAVTFKVTQRQLRPSTFFPHFDIQFNFSFKIEHFNYILDTEYSSTPLFIESRPSENSSSATVAVAASLSSEDVAEAVRSGLGNRLTEDESRELVERAWEEVREEFPAETLLPRLKTLDVGFDVKIKYHDVFIKIWGLREKRRARRGGAEEERWCCICLQELAGSIGGGPLWMPCLHVFHGGCVRAWLRRSRYCPICRYEMPQIE